MNDNKVRISNKRMDLTGVGTEYLVVNGEVIAKFFDGNMCESLTMTGNTDKTVTGV